MARDANPTRNPDYYAARAAEERRLAQTCGNARARAAHLELAERYEMLARACAAAPEQDAKGRVTA